MNQCIECCSGACNCNCMGFRCTDSCFPRPFSLITTLLVILELIFIGLTLGYLISESRSDSFQANCPTKMIIHPIIMICITCINIFVSFSICSFYNKGIKDPRVKQPNIFFMKRTSQLLCYNIPFCVYYVFIIGFIVFIILGQLLLFDQKKPCIESFQMTIAFDYVLVAIFLLIITFGMFFVCCAINVNSVEGCECVNMVQFTLNILTCGTCFKNKFKKEANSKLNTNREVQFRPEEMIHRDNQGHLPKSHNYDQPEENLQIQRTNENSTGLAGKLVRMFDN